MAMRLITDGVVAFRGYHGCDSRCRIRVYQGCPCCEPSVVIATEVGDNPGTSITNMAEDLASEILTRLKVSPNKFIWIEHYPPRNYFGGRPTLAEGFDRVEFTWHGCRFVKPEWQRIEKATVEQLVQQLLSD